MAAAASTSARTIAFEVRGKVQGVFFRKYTAEKATALGLGGWIRNTARKTVEGEIQGPDAKLAMMRAWLSETGSPSSRISGATFTELKAGTPYGGKFEVRR